MTPNENALVPAGGSSSSSDAVFAREDPALANTIYGEQPAILPEAEIDRELKQIDDLRRNNRREYDRDNAVQARARELLAMKAQYDESNAQDRRWKTRAAQIMRSMPEVDRFEQSYDKLWANLDDVSRDAIRYELSLPATEHPARPASEADVRRFAKSDVGGELVREWGGTAGKKLALIRARAERLMRVDLDAGFEWFERLPKAQAKTLIKIMGGA